MNLEHLKVALAVANCGSFTRAAELLGQTPSAISRKISALEAHLGTQLFSRTTRKLRITEEGRHIIEKARQAMNLIDDIEDCAGKRQQSPQGRLKVDAPSPFIEQCVIPNLHEYQRQYPKVAIELCSFDQVVNLIEEQIDIAFRIGELKDSSLYYRSIGHSRLRLLASPDYLDAHGTPHHPEDLDQHQCIGFSQPSSLNKWPITHGRKDYVEISPAIVASSGSAIRQLALNGVGIACLAGFMTYEDIDQGHLVPLLEDFSSGYAQPINAIFQRELKHSLKLKSFIEHLQQALSQRLD